MSNLTKFRMTIDECGEIIFSSAKLVMALVLLVKSLKLLALIILI